jgi:polysaccharide biosynthesis protein PslH
VETDAYQRLWALERRGLRKAARFADWRQVRAWERRWPGRADAVTVCSQRDAERLQDLVAALPEVRVVPNGIDLDDVPFHDGPREPATLLFVGGMAYAPNIDGALRLARDVMPRVWESRPETALLLVGKDPPPEVRELEGDRVAVTGEVESVRPYLDRATLAAIPLRTGGGTRIKILEAMAAGVPVVTTPLGAEGLDLEHGREAWIADSDGELAAGILQLLSDRHRAATLAAAARRRAEADFGWDRSARELAALLTSCAAAPPGPPRPEPA